MWGLAGAGGQSESGDMAYEEDHVTADYRLEEAICTLGNALVGKVDSMDAQQVLFASV